MFGPKHIFGLDIETDNSAGHGLNPAQSRVTEVAIAVDKRLDDRGGAVFAHEDEHDLLVAMNDYLSQQPPGLLSTWNGSVFDFPFIADRLPVAGKGLPPLVGGPVLTADPEIRPKYEPLPGHQGGYSVVWFRGNDPVPHQHLDIAYAYKAAADRLGVSWSLKPVCKALGISMVEVDRTALHLLTPEEREAYCLSDASGTRELAIRALGAHPFD